LRKRDIGFLLVLALAIYISLDNTSFIYRLEPAWYFDQRKAGVSGKDFPRIPPIVTDLDGDGQKEIIFITRDQHIKILDADKPGDFSEEVYVPEERVSVRLSPLLNVNAGHNPVALASGYIEHYDQSRSRKQVIVLVREDLTVSCYDASLELLWEKALAHNSFNMAAMIERFEIDEISVLISPIKLDATEEGRSEGIILVGVSMKSRDGTKVKIEQGIDPLANGDEEHPEMDTKSKLGNK
jgi:hypothetical protein